MSHIDNPEHETDRLARMFAAQKKLQMLTFEHYFGDMTTQERVDYIKENVLALTDELHELLAETSWKPWAKSEFLNTDKVVSELTDAWHFMMNIMIATMPWLSPGDMADMLTESYEKKRAVNVKRQDDGYDGQSTKCPECKRALDDVGATTIDSADDQIVICVGCGANVTDAYNDLIGTRE